MEGEVTRKAVQCHSEAAFRRRISRVEDGIFRFRWQKAASYSSR